MEILLVGTIQLGFIPDSNTLGEIEPFSYSDVHYEQLTADFAKFQADQVFVEFPFESHKYLNTIYRSKDVNEGFKESVIYQIGFRLAKKLGHKGIYAVDWNEQFEGVMDIGLVAEGKSKVEYEEIMKRIHTQIDKTFSIAQQGDMIKLYKYINSREFIANDHRVYVDLMQLEDEIAFEWVTKYWYYRNLRIVKNIKKLMKPETKRAVIVYEAANTYLIKQQLEDQASIKIIQYGDWSE